jgi:hypothetical protein
MGVSKAFVYFFNDDDKPQLHAGSGLTRNFKPKPAYHAVAWMLDALKDHRFAKAASKSLEQGYSYEFQPDAKTAKDQPNILAVWHATQENQEISLPMDGRAFIKAERMPLQPGAAEIVTPVSLTTHTLKLKTGGRPIFLWLK